MTAGVNVPGGFSFLNERLRTEQLPYRCVANLISEATSPPLSVTSSKAAASTHARTSRVIALEDADAASGLVCVDVKADRESPDLDRLGSGARRLWRNGG